MFSQYIVTCQSKQGLFFIYQLVIGIYREGMSWEELGQWCELSWVPLSYGGKFATSTATPVLYSGAPTLKQSPAAPVNEPIIPWSIKGKRVWCQMKQEIIDEHGGHRTALIFCKARSSAQTSNKNELFLHANERSFPNERLCTMTTMPRRRRREICKWIILLDRSSTLEFL